MNGSVSRRSNASCDADPGSIAPSSGCVTRRTTDAASSARRVSGSGTSSRYMRVSSVTTRAVAASSSPRSGRSRAAAEASVRASGWPRAIRFSRRASSGPCPRRLRSSSALLVVQRTERHAVEEALPAEPGGHRRLATDEHETHALVERRHEDLAQPRVHEAEDLEVVERDDHRLAERAEPAPIASPSCSSRPSLSQRLEQTRLGRLDRPAVELDGGGARGSMRASRTATSADLPIPASPWTCTTRASPAGPTRASSIANSSSRPTKERCTRSASTSPSRWGMLIARIL